MDVDRTAVAGTHATADEGELSPGTMVGEYRIEAVLGEGGFGSVYRAVHPIIGKTAAIKGKTAAIKGKTAAIKGKTAAIKGKTAAIKGKTAAIKGKTAAIKGKTAAVKAIAAAAPSSVPESPMTQTSLLDETTS